MNNETDFYRAFWGRFSRVSVERVAAGVADVRAMMHTPTEIMVSPVDEAEGGVAAEGVGLPCRVNAGILRGEFWVGARQQAAWQQSELMSAPTTGSERC